MIAFSVHSQTKGTLTNNSTPNWNYNLLSLFVHDFFYSLTSDVSCSPVVLSTQGMGGAQKAVLMACTTCAPVCPWQLEKTTGRGEGAGRL